MGKEYCEKHTEEWDNKEFFICPYCAIENLTKATKPQDPVGSALTAGCADIRRYSMLIEMGLKEAEELWKGGMRKEAIEVVDRAYKDITNLLEVLKL